MKALILGLALGVFPRLDAPIPGQPPQSAEAPAPSPNFERQIALQAQMEAVVERMTQAFKRPILLDRIYFSSQNEIAFVTLVDGATKIGLLFVWEDGWKVLPDDFTAR